MGLFNLEFTSTISYDEVLYRLTDKCAPMMIPNYWTKVERRADNRYSLSFDPKGNWSGMNWRVYDYVYIFSIERQENVARIIGRIRIKTGPLLLILMLPLLNVTSAYFNHQPSQYFVALLILVGAISYFMFELFNFKWTVRIAIPSYT